MSASSGDIVLALNSGSSSLKFGLYAVDAGDPTMLFDGQIDSARGDASAVDRIAVEMAAAGLPKPTVTAHRIVHGGPTLLEHCLIDAVVIDKLKAASAFAPLHGPVSLALIEAAALRYPGLPQIACFDTAFHAGMPQVAYTLPLPKALRAEGIRRYGFHGLSCESILQQLDTPLPDRIVIAHLGNGSSVTAIHAGRSIDTSMGLTPSGGVMMATRTGDIDPGVLLHLLGSKSLGMAALADLIDRQSGMQGISGVSGDMRRLHEASATNPDARLAIDMFCYSVRKQIAAMIAALGGIDLMVFTGGIGEHDPVVLSRVCDGLAWAGLSLTDAHRQHASCEVSVLSSREGEQIARHAHHILAARPNGGARYAL